ncbi:MAG TPA: 16S rRNA (guanine(966)-N(2))-methyltransferase RsmD [Gammaproteobacteria bacterium]|nr:16S rRNA (guanine(966)-N(2))-methyltransferase RsmD [Gammaproteobacteria bacterium]
MPQRSYKNEFRIVAGTWRSRRCTFPPREGLRPTPDRVRETLFNWLGNRIERARCLDLFAGSGALGLEALSRGAARTVFVERDREAAQGIEANLARLDAAGAEVAAVDAVGYLRSAEESFDIVFLDPPFASGLLELVLDPLQARLRPDAYVYLEFPFAAGVPPLPANWRLLKSKRAGQVGYGLAAI